MRESSYRSQLDLSVTADGNPKQTQSIDSTDWHYRWTLSLQGPHQLSNAPSLQTLLQTILNPGRAGPDTPKKKLNR